MADGFLLEAEFKECHRRPGTQISEWTMLLGGLSLESSCMSHRGGLDAIYSRLQV